MSGEPWIILGEYTDDWGNRVEVGLPLRDMRVHTSILGTTGSGKSTFSRNLALQAFDLGATTVIIEPHGDLILDPKEGILAALSPTALDRVVVVDLNSPRPPQINLATAGLSAGRSVAVATAMRCIRVAEEASWSGAVRMREILEHALHLLLNVFDRRASMVLLQRFLTDVPFRDRVLAQAGDEVGESKSYWQRLSGKIENARGRSADDVLEVPLRRVGKFLRDDRFRRSLALPALGRGLEIAPLMDAPEPKMILVPLQSAELGEEAKRVFGTLFMQMVTNAFMARSSQAAEERRQTFVLIDEFADLAEGVVGELVKILLAQARKFGASVVLSTQSIYQLPADVKLEVRSNTNIKVVLRTSGRDDAKEAVLNLASDRLSESDVMSIERFHGYARVMVHGSPQPPFYFKGLPPIRLQGRGNNRCRRLPARPDYPRELEELHRMVGYGEEDQAIARLVSMPDGEFRAMVKAEIETAGFQADLLLADPGLEPDPVRRALRVSRLRVGLPWWFYEAQYRRLRYGEVGDRVA
ncbi:MAG TPA: ATP-binding protein [Anaerolineae bacterium]|nr:ATP-binding protein [Anaerolineae bacterium]